MPSLRGHRSYPLLEQDINRLLSGPFAEVQEDLTIRTIPRGHSRRLFKEYPEALSVAGMILKRYGFSYEEISRSTSVPPHWIDMTRLFELYVYAILRERFPGMIEFQVPGHFGTQADFVKRDEYLVVDAKYKFHYESGEVLDDIRQLSGYARDKRILRHFENGAKGLVPACLIIYPNKIGMKGDDVRVIPGSDEVLPDGASRLLDEADSIESFENFYKMAIPLPLR
jgi:5-methylcytosine-specific restriction enzyme subunit McrC